MVLTQNQTQHEGEIACGCCTAQNQNCDPKKWLLNFKLQVRRKKERRSSWAEYSCNTWLHPVPEGALNLSDKVKRLQAYIYLLFLFEKFVWKIKKTLWTRNWVNFKTRVESFFQLFHVLLQSRSQPIFIGSNTLQKLRKNIFILQRCFFQLFLQARNETNWSTTGAKDAKDHFKPTTTALQKHLLLFPIPLLEELQPQPCLFFRVWLVLSSKHVYRKCTQEVFQRWGIAHSL